MSRRLAVLLVATVLASSARARAGDEKAVTDDDPALFSCTKPQAKFTVALKPDVELKDLVTWAMGFSCKRFLYGSALSARTAKVTMITPGAMSAPQAWGLFEVSLHSMGLTMVAKGGVIEILESPIVKDEALAIRSSFPDGGADVVRLLFRPEHVDAADLAAALDLVKSKNGTVAPLPKLRAVLVTDDADHVARMRPMVEELDRPATADAIFAIPLAHVDAQSVVATIDKLLDTGPGAGAGAASGAAASPHMRIVADERSNALFVAGTAADYVRVKNLATAIDVDTGTDSGAHLIRLQHAKAKDLATALNALLSGAPAAGAGGASARAPAESGGGFAPSGAVRITADDASNSLLVMASAHDAASLRALVDEMDAPVQQVYIEALVLEVDASEEQKLGVSWHGGKLATDGSLSIGGFVTPSLSSADPSSVTSATGFIGGTIGALVPGSEKLLGNTIPSYGLLLEASTHDSRLDVLASPHILTVDNKQAKISVGENIPYRTSTQSQTSGGTILPASIARQPVALTLTITPHVAPAPPEVAGVDREVALDIDLQDSELGTEDFSGDLGPTWKDRSLTTSVVLHDEETLVLGGLVDERTQDTVDKIPILGDIPLLGRLFRQTDKVRRKTNLLVLITPHVLDDTAEGREILARRMRERDEFVRSAHDLEQRAWRPSVQPRKMRGLIADIDANVRSVERERAELEAAARPHGVTPGPVDPSPAAPPTPPPPATPP